MFDDRKLRSAGTAMVCFSLLVYEVFSSRLLSVVVEGHMAIFAIALAMLGMGAATSIMSLTDWPRKGAGQDRVLSRLALVLGIIYPLCLLVVAVTNEQNNTVIDAAIAGAGFKGLIGAIQENLLNQMVWLGFVMFIPYFVFGIFIAALFKCCKESDYHAIYAADLIGAALGCILFAVALDQFGYRGGLILIIVPTFLGAAAFAMVRRGRAAIMPGVLAGIAFVALLSPTAVSIFEPHPALNQLARNYNQEFEVEQTWYVWNAHSRVAHLNLTDRRSGDKGQVYAHETGTGWAIIPQGLDGASGAGRTGVLQDPRHPSKLGAVFDPERVLVLFAGVGMDMVHIDDACAGKCQIVGVEINEHMVDHAIVEDLPGVRELLDKAGAELVTAEAREYLGRDRTQYDSIVLSWWGAGTSHYLGVSGQLAQYLYTVEAFDSLLDHLTTRGIVVLFNGNKAQILLSLRKVFHDRNLGSLSGKVVIVSPASEKPEEANFLEPVDSKRMIVKPAGFSEAELATLRNRAEEYNLKVILAPGYVAPGYQIYQDIVDGMYLTELNSQLSGRFNAELSVVTDNRPFLEHTIPDSHYLDIDKWTARGSASAQWKFLQFYLIFVVFLAIAAIMIVMFPLILRAGPAVSGRNAMNLYYFFALGAGFILIEVAFVRKFSLILGHPSYAIAIVLAALILSTGIGSLCTRWLFEKFGAVEKQVALAIVLYALGLGASYDALATTIISLPVAVKALLVIAGLFPLGFLMGQLFPQGLIRVTKDDFRLVPWAWAINATASTVGVGMADPISRPAGFNMVLYIGIVFYAGIILLPLHRRARTPVPA